MKKLKPKLFALEQIKNKSITVQKKSGNVSPLRRYGKAIIFKDCEPNETTYFNISKLLQSTESFKISYFNIISTDLTEDAKSSENPAHDFTNSTKNSSIYVKKNNKPVLNNKMQTKPKIRTPNTRKYEKFKRNNHKSNFGERCLSLNFKNLQFSLDLTK